MNNRQTWGIGLVISGIGTAVVGIFGIAANVTPDWVNTGLRVLSTILPMLGFVINFPSDTNPK